MARIESGYHSNPYHNAVHAASVTNDANFLMSTCGFGAHMDAQEVFSLLFAAAIHDFEHPGRTNKFEVRRGAAGPPPPAPLRPPAALPPPRAQVETRSGRAILYNDQSVLENHHVAAAYGLATRPEWAVFAGLGSEQYRQTRGMVIQLVLATDLRCAARGFGGGEAVPDQCVCGQAPFCARDGSEGGGGERG